ncbi:MAG TPA: calcium incorporation protein MxaA, partial [Burkholderiaceae bacterium]|nr:calcium incorporation protein MxaA [Burkholderiaceae bacterium]
IPTLQPDRPAPLRDVTGERRRLVALSTALGACLLAWLGWLAWREMRARRSQPFAHALHLLGLQHERAAGDAGTSRRILHGAFDRTAAEVVRTSNLPRLFERAPHLVPLRARIERFFAQSEAYFFSGTPRAEGGSGAGSEADSSTSLCRDLRRLERAAER